jgi:membrane protease YdiL (CAAX protease family)
LTSFLPLLFFAVVLTLLYERTNVLLAPIISHAFFNAVNFGLLLLQPELLQWN